MKAKIVIVDVKLYMKAKLITKAKVKAKVIKITKARHIIKVKSIKAKL